MRSLMELGLLGVLLSSPKRPTETDNPALWQMVKGMGIDLSYWVNAPSEEIVQRANQILGALDNDISYYDASELKVNEILNRYLVELHYNYTSFHKEDPRQIAIMICALGNKVLDKDDTSGVNLWVEQAQQVIERIWEMFDNQESLNDLQPLLANLAYCEKVLQIVDVFVTTHNGMLAGLEEYRPADYNDVYPLYVPDFTTGTECGGHEGCECGCKLDHPLMVLEGMEDLLNGRDTAAAKYTAGVFFANDMRLTGYQGNEAGVIDSIKEMGTKAYEWCRDALKSFFELFSSEKAEQDAKDAETVAENNKKAIQSMADKSVHINDSAKQGIVALAKATDATGAMSKVVATLNTANDASRVLDGLQAILNKNLGKSGQLNDKLKEAQAALDELKAANSKVNSVNPDNKEVVTNTKTNLSDKIAKAKAKVSEVKAAATAQKKVVNGINKAIKGISPKIFTKDPETKPTEGKPTEAKPAKAPAKPKKATKAE